MQEAAPSNNKQRSTIHSMNEMVVITRQQSPWNHDIVPAKGMHASKRKVSRDATLPRHYIVKRRMYVNRSITLHNDMSMHPT